VIDHSTREKILDAANIVDVVSDFVTLRKKGVNYVGLCPFHPDKTPSFTVSPSKNICKCFSCGEGGTPVYFIMKHEQLGYNDALKCLAKKYHIDVQERELTNDEKQMQDTRESMFIVNAYAQKHFTSRLFEHEEGRTIGLSYFNERGFREETIRKFQLGYALEKRDDLYQTALQAGYKAEFLEKTGLVGIYENGVAADRFRGRIIFPVHTMSGKVVAFGGRILRKNEKTAKYVNSPESEIYHKSHELYGIYFAKQAITKAEKCFLVEGYTDVISMFQAGVENVVASSGTALTAGQINLIRRLTNNITVIYDGDAAGIKAAIRGIDLLLEEGMNVKVVLLPDGEDPDSFARKNNAFEFSLFIQKQETDFIRFKTQLLLNEAGNDPIKKATLIADILQSIALIPDNIIRSVYIKDCSDLLEIKELTLINELNKIRLKKRTAPTANQTLPTSISDTPQFNNTNTTTQAINSQSSTVIPAKTEINSQLASPPASPISPVSPVSPASPASPASPISPFSPFSPTFKPFEEALLHYVIQYGERILFDYMEEDEHIVIRVAEYIHTELQEDNLTFLIPEYRKILEEAVEHCHEQRFSAMRYFLYHPDPNVCCIAVYLTDEKYFPHLDLQEQSDVSSKKEKDRIEWERGYTEQIEVLERAIVYDLFALKSAHNLQQLNDTGKAIKDLQTRGEIDESMKLMKEYNRLKAINKELSKKTGERVVLKM
jgi:DNA primase